MRAIIIISTLATLLATSAFASGPVPPMPIPNVTKAKVHTAEEKQAIRLFKLASPIPPMPVGACGANQTIAVTLQNKVFCLPSADYATLSQQGLIPNN